MLTSILLWSALLGLPESVPATESKACLFRPTHATPIFVGDAIEQTLLLDASAGCQTDAGKPRFGDGNYLLTNTNNSSARANVILSRDANGRYTLRITTTIDVDDPTITGITTTWNLYAADPRLGEGAPIAQVQVETRPLRVHTTVQVLFPLFRKLNTIIADAGKPPGLAFVGPEKQIINVAHLDVPLTLLGEASGTQWSIVSQQAAIPECGGDVCRIRDVREIPYTLEIPSEAPIEAVLLRVHRDETLRIRVRLADRAQKSSIPLDLAASSYLLCQKDVRNTTWDEIPNARPAALVNYAITNNLCRYVISPEDVKAALAIRHAVPFSRYVCREGHNGGEREQSGSPDTRAAERTTKDLESQCAKAGANKGERITVMSDDSRKDIETLQMLYGTQVVRMSMFKSIKDKDESIQEFVFNARDQRKTEITLNFHDKSPSPDAPYYFEANIAAFDHAVPGSDERDQERGARGKIPEYHFSTTLRPKGPFGITHIKGSLGSKSIRVFLTVPLSFFALRTPAAGLDIRSTQDSRTVQLTSLTSGLLLTLEPWDYVQGKNMLALPVRFQTGALFSNWYKGQFQPSFYIGGALTLPVFRGTSQLDTDIALGFGWEVDLRNGYEKFAQRSHFLVTFGMNIFSLLGPQSSPRK